MCTQSSQAMASRTTTTRYAILKIMSVPVASEETALCSRIDAENSPERARLFTEPHSQNFAKLQENQ